VFRTLLIVTTIVACASIAAAQDDYKKFEFFGGYSHNRVDTDSLTQNEGFHGFETAATANLSRYFGLKFDFSAHFNNQSIPLFSIQGGQPGTLDIDSQLYNFLGGVQLKDNSTDSTLKPFAHALVGAAHARNKLNFNQVGCIAIFPSPCVNQTVSETGFAGAFGGGLDIRVSDRIDVRAVQVDYNPTRLFDSTQHNFRIGVGIVIH
jgi:Outer membrane protein beta-barrel domain